MLGACARLRSLVCKNVKFKRTTPVLSRIRNSSHVASCGTGRNACATECNSKAPARRRRYKKQAQTFEARCAPDGADVLVARSGTACRAPTVALVGVVLVWRGSRRCCCSRRGRAWQLFLRRGLRRNACRLRRWASPFRRMRGNRRNGWARRPIRVRRRARSPRADADLKFRGRNGRAPTSCRLRRRADDSRRRAALWRRRVLRRTGARRHRRRFRARASPAGDLGYVAR